MLLFFMAIIVSQVLWAQGNESSVLRIKIVPSLGETVKPQKSDIDSIINTGVVALDALNRKYAIVKMKRVFPYSAKYESRHKKHGLHLWYDLEVTGSFTEDEIVSDFGRIHEVTKAELKQAPKLIDPQKPVVYNAITTKSASNDLPFDDPLLDKQWHYNNYGQSGGEPGADIRLFEAWKKSAGSPNVIVSVHDMGVDVAHEDLKDAVWVNEVELNGEAGVDDDNNGYVDDINGFDFVTSSGKIAPGYHATHVAGTIGATNNNGLGVSGIAGGTGNNDGVKIMSCSILGAPETNIAASFVYAADNGAVISQNSWGYSTPGQYSQAVHDAIDYFIEEAGNYPGSPMRGGVVIFAVGNTGIEGEFFPAAYDRVVSVTALSSENIIAPYSNYGDWVDIAAPGGNSGDNAVLSGKDKTYSNEIMSTLENNQYGFLDGTSMACPHVSGVAALIASKFQGENFTNEELLTHLLTGVNDSIYDVEYNKDFMGKIGLGIVDANLALATDNKIPPGKTNLQFTGELAQDFVGLQWIVPKDDDDIVPFSYEIIYSENEITNELLNEAKVLDFKNNNQPGDTLNYDVSGLKPTTTYNFAVRYIDRWGNKASFSNIVTVTTNEGPLVKNIGDTVSIDINVKIEKSVKQDSFLLVNQGEGVLRWDLETRHSEGIPYSVQSAAEIYAPIKPEAYSKQRSILQTTAKTKIQAYNIEDDHDEEYSDLISDTYLIVIGETDTTLPNSAASRFTVANKEGFNLTHVDTYIEIDDPTTQPIIEIYKGEDIKTARLLLSQTIDEVSTRFTRVSLYEQLFFNFHETFWIVVHVPPGNLYPLGTGIESTPDGSKNSFMSNDYGKSWDLIEDLIPDDQLVWAVYAMSRYEKLDQYITLTPNNGKLLSGDSIMIVATVDGENMVDGNYRGNVLINTNETERENFRIPIDINISGHDPKIQAPVRVDFGSVLMGYKKYNGFTLKNVGLSRLDVKPPYFTFDDPQFKYVQGVNTEFDSGDEQEIYFSFTPTKPGLSIAYATILDENGDNHTFELIGVGLEPPIVKLEPADTTYQHITIGDTIEGKFTIKNEGKFTLDYFMPTFADGLNMEYVPENFHRFGYRTKINPGGIYD
ncbi:MAG: S8 family serine peptidase, partial [Draconibacterium sp.]|nr:S8 family serine peptidase [Draconibacterium sp.]